jgi:hypothetical protein
LIFFCIQKLVAQAIFALENDYIKVLILPQIVGKTWTAIENPLRTPSTLSLA